MKKLTFEVLEYKPVFVRKHTVTVTCANNADSPSYHGDSPMDKVLDEMERRGVPSNYASEDEGRKDDSDHQRLSRD